MKKHENKKHLHKSMKKKKKTINEKKKKKEALLKKTALVKVANSIK